MEEEIRALPCAACHVCGSLGVQFYRGLKDGLFGTTGQWNMNKCSNEDCGLLWLDPMPVEEDIGRAYKVYYTHQEAPGSESLARKVVERARKGFFANRYGLRRQETPAIDRALGKLIGFVPPFREMLDMGFSQFADFPKGRVLEVGCGNGEWLKRVGDLGWQAEGVEPDPQAAQIARAKGLDVNHGTLFDQRYSENEFNFIFSSHVIEHVANPISLLIECRRILRPGGRIVFATPNADSWLHGRFRQYWRGLEPPRHLHIFTPKSLLALAKKSGFQNCRISSSSRGVGEIFITSKALRDHSGKKTGAKLAIERVESELVRLAGWAVLKINPMAGEALSLEAQKYS